MQGNPTLATEIGEMIVRIIEADQCGIFHCCGGESATRLELAQATAQVFGLDANLIQPSPPDPTDPASLTGIPVPQDTRLEFTCTASRLAYQPPRPVSEPVRAPAAVGDGPDLVAVWEGLGVMSV